MLWNFINQETVTVYATAHPSLLVTCTTALEVGIWTLKFSMQY